jgi:hypothetical protein
MRRLLWGILIVVVLVAVVTGCGGAHRYDARLVAADSFMQSAPDSALALVEALPAGSLPDEGDRAYRDLLLTQSRYRCYIVATSDSDINRALAYYRAHSGEREKLTRAYIYKGAVMDELGHPDSAMFYYKHAEATAAPDDYFNLGYVNLRIANLYQNKYINATAIIKRTRNAYHYFKQIQDTEYMATSIGKLGTYLYDSDKDSARICLEQAIKLARSIGSSRGFFYQSKLAGIYFYQGDFAHSKNLAMDIILNAKNQCDENQFYYYAARSFIRLGEIDSALWVQRIIPKPTTRQDSMNHYLLISDLSRASNQTIEKEVSSAKAIDIENQMLHESLKSELPITEIRCEASQQATYFKKRTFQNLIITLCLILLALSVLLLFLKKLIQKKINKYQNNLDDSRIEIEQLLESTSQKIRELEREKESQRDALAIKEEELNAVTQRNIELESQQADLHSIVADIVMLRQSALNELYNEIKVRTRNDDVRRHKTLIALIKELNDNKDTLHFSPKESFWEKLKSSVDGEFNGIATFVEHKYPSLTTKENHLFWLLCANISPQIIKLCMDYSSAITVSNYKRKLIKERIGMDVRFDEFIQMYLDGKLN